jgi:hypothetical protein
MTTPTKARRPTRGSETVTSPVQDHPPTAAGVTTWVSITDLLYGPGTRQAPPVEGPVRAEQMSLWSPDTGTAEPDEPDDDRLTALEQLLEALDGETRLEVFVFDEYTNVHAELDANALRDDLARLIAAAPAWARPREDEDW